MPKKELLYYFSIIFVIVISCFFGIKLFLNNETNIKDAKLLNSSIRSVKEIPNSLNNNENGYLEKYKELRNYYDNENIIGRLLIVDLDIDTILTKTTNNKYYLTHNLYNKVSTLGNTFVDYRTDLSSKQINIYGHNSTKYDVPFKRLEKYLNYENYQNNKIVIIEGENGQSKYEIFSVNIVASDNEEHLNVDFDTDEEWLSHFTKLKQDSIYDTGVSVNGEDNILVLQTCLFNSSKKSYLIINAKKI